MAGRTDTMNSISWKFAVLQLVCAFLVVVILYFSMDWQLLPRVKDSFVAQCEVVTAGLAQAVESPLVARDITSAQAAIDQLLRDTQSLRDPGSQLAAAMHEDLQAGDCRKTVQEGGKLDLVVDNIPADLYDR